MATDEFFSFVVQQIATIASIIVIVIAAVRSINKTGDDKIKKAKEEIIGEVNQRQETVETSIKNLEDHVNTIKQYIERDLQRHERILERLDTANVNRFGGAKDFETR